ncbi:hypothetical protein [Pontibacter mangrovi]|nr:hypothetical protein [Pontibacter mangrovi]
MPKRATAASLVGSVEHTVAGVKHMSITKEKIGLQGDQSCASPTARSP